MGAGLTIDQTGTAAIYSSFDSVGDTVVSYATIDASAADVFYIQPAVFVNHGQINADTHGGTLEIIPTELLTNYGAIAVSNGENATIENGTEAVANDTGGVISVDTGSSITIDASGLANEGGTLEVNGGTLTVDCMVEGTGAATIAGGGTLDFQSSVDSGQTVTFEDATGTLTLGDPGDFHATISGLVDGDAIDVTGTVTCAMPGSYNGTTTTLTLYDGDTVVGTLTLQGDYCGDTFTPTPIESGSITQIEDPPGDTGIGGQSIR